MVMAFEKFKDYWKDSDTVKNHRKWLQDYEGMVYSIAVEEKHTMQWKKEAKKYYDKLWRPQINCIKELPNRIRIDFDDKDDKGEKDKKKIKENVEKVLQVIKGNGWGYIVSSHQGSSDYIWLEFTRMLTDEEKEAFLVWIAPEGSEIDLNFASSKRVFAVMFASHWRHQYKELPLEFVEGGQINYDSLHLKIQKTSKSKQKTITKEEPFQYKTFVKEVKTQIPPDKLKEIYNRIIKVLKTYCELKKEYYNIIALWIMGTYSHDDFLTYPYLFFNAMRGSGKTRILNLISKMAYNGKLVSNMSEAVLFRTAKNRTICIDEFEEVGSKDKAALRELLNSAYKKGMSVERIIKSKQFGQECYNVESFDLYCPIAMANIWGAEDVLSDRCITLVLERSQNRSVTRLMELFDKNEDISFIKKEIGVGSVAPDGSAEYHNFNSLVISKSSEMSLNISDTTDTTHTTHTTNTTDTQPTTIQTPSFLDKIVETSLEGRDLELFFPLFIIAQHCGVLDETIKVAEEIVKSKREEDLTESRDVSFLNYIAQREESGLFIPLRKIVNEFKDIEEGEDWVTPEWVGRSLKRLGLITEKKRVRQGREIIINVGKAKEKVKIFK
jgi:hypothetical protein